MLRVVVGERLGRYVVVDGGVVLAQSTCPAERGGGGAARTDAAKVTGHNVNMFVSVNNVGFRLELELELERAID